MTYFLHQCLSRIKRKFLINPIIQDYSLFLKRNFKQQTCYFCRCNSQRFFCSVCSNDLAKLHPSGLNFDALRRQDIRKAVGKCHFDSLYAPYIYQWPLDVVIKDLKFSRKEHLGKPLAHLLCEHIKLSYSYMPLPEAIIPVPLHWTRYWYRKYNQATAIAKPIANELKIPLITDWCVRKHRTKAQTRLNGQKRRLNLRRAFEITNTRGLYHIALVDDVLTTGATVNNLALAIKKKNPNIKIDVWVLAISSENISNA